MVQAVLWWIREREESDDDLDNVDDLNWIKNILPRGPRGNVILTSQDEQSVKLFLGAGDGSRCEKNHH